MAIVARKFDLYYYINHGVDDNILDSYGSKEYDK